MIDYQLVNSVSQVSPLAGQRLLPPTGVAWLHFGLFRHFKGVVNLNAEIAHSAFQFCVAEQQLYRPQILRSPINQRRLRPSKRVSTVTCGIQSQLSDPRIDDPGILPRG